MNLNNFVVLPSKPKSMKLNVRNLRELRMEKLQLDQQTKEMESKLEELRERMSQEKEEREKTGASRWRSAQPKVLAPAFHNAKTNKENATQRLSPGKMKIRVLKDEPLPVVQKQVVGQPAVKTQGAHRKLRLKGKVCGQCEVQLAGLMCSECGEDYCVGCFVRFHQRGALQRHRMIPIQAQLQTPVTTRDVLDRNHQQVSREQNGTIPKSADERETPVTKNIQPVSDVQTQQVLFVNDGVDVDNEEGGEEDDSSLLKGYFDEEESARSFQEALNEWREKGQTGDTFRPRPVSAMETQTEKRLQQFIHLDFKEDTLSYMEKLLLKKSRRGQIEEFRQQLDGQHHPDLTAPPPAETDELSQKLTEEQMELRKYFASLFKITPAEDAGKINCPAESCLSIVELDEMDTDAMTYRSLGVEEKTESKMFASINYQNKVVEFGCSITTSTPSQMTKATKLNSSLQLWPPTQETDRFPSSLPKSESSHLLQESSSESFPNVPREDRKVECSSQVILSTKLSDSPEPESWTRSSTAQLNKSSDLVPSSSSLSLRRKLNPTNSDHDVNPSPGSLPSTRKHSPLLLAKSPKPPDAPFSTSRLASFSVNRRLEHSTSQSNQSSECVTALLKTASPDSIKSHTDGNTSPPSSKWLKSARKSPKTTTLSLHLDISDSEEEMTGDDVCLVPSEEDSSDEELRCINDSEVMKNIASSPRPATTYSTDSLLSFRCLSESGLLTGSSQALLSLAQRQDVQPGQDQGLEGFFTLGLKGEDLQLSPTPAQTSRERRSSTDCSLAGVQDLWRPSSSLRHNADEGLVNVLVNSRPIRSPLRSVTPCRDASSQRQSFSSHQDVLSRRSSSSSLIQSISTHRVSSSCRPLSRAAHEIMEVQSVERPDLQNSDEEEQDCLALACLEEEFRNMSCTPRDQDEMA
ncbi:uncharacterized protein zbbx isoform X2 [Misgurnus anguillicaudatus]|uniref:uncharacterized protein zbbx isoform X2 n=1 Tax=Misgurnus anguillicaudatus TaxID=75329 RepID=UPI003CCF58FB